MNCYFICPHCKKRIDYDVDLTGEKVQCFHCEDKFIVEEVFQDLSDESPHEEIHASVDADEVIKVKGPLAKRKSPTLQSQDAQFSLELTRESTASAQEKQRIGGQKRQKHPVVAKRKKSSNIPLIIIFSLLFGGGGFFGYKWFMDNKKSQNHGNSGIKLSFEDPSATETLVEKTAPDIQKGIASSIERKSKKNELTVKFMDESVRVPESLEANVVVQNSVLAQGLDIEILPNSLTSVGGAEIDPKSGDLMIKRSGGGFSWKGKVAKPGTYQMWVTYFCNDKSAEEKLEINGKKKSKKLMYMGRDIISRFFGKNCKAQRGTKRHPFIPEKYYFREYLGSFDIDSLIDLKLTYSGVSDISVNKIEFMQERPFRKELEPLLFAGIDFYTKQHLPGELVSCTYNIKKDRGGDTSSIAVCGIALAAHSMNYVLGRDPNAEKKVLELLRIFNGKNRKVKPDRHKSGFFRHFVNVKSGKGKSEFSTIDTSILVSGALIARNTFKDPRIKVEADKLWNSIDWSKAVVSTDPSKPRFYLAGDQIDGKRDGSISMYNEYILLAYFCQKYEDQKKGSKARKFIMPDVYQLPRSVYQNRIILGNSPQPSFLVQFPFYMSELCNDELFFSYTAGQALADRSTCIERYGNRSDWGVAPGDTPTSGYSVDSYAKNPDNVVRPHIVAGFIPVLPLAAEDLYLRFKNPENRMKLKFGTILPSFVPGNPDWKSFRIPGVDFSCMMYGMAAYHPKLGLKFFREKTKFTFNQ